MQPLGDKILVKLIKETDTHKEWGTIKKTDSGIFKVEKEELQKVEVVEVSQDTQTILKTGDICLSAPGGVEVEDGIWLRSEKLLHCRL